MRIAKRKSLSKARVAVARKLAVMLHLGSTALNSTGQCNDLQRAGGVIATRVSAAWREKTSLPASGDGEIVHGCCDACMGKARFTHWSARVTKRHYAEDSARTRREPWAGQGLLGELDFRSGIREQPGNIAGKAIGLNSQTSSAKVEFLKLNKLRL
jgi:hypothetical protein